MELDSDAPGLIGRAGVWAELITLLDPDRADPAGALLVGPAGIGKTTLVDRFADRAGRLGFPVARAVGEAGAEPYSVLRALFAGADLDALPGGQRLALAGAMSTARPLPQVDLLALRAAVRTACSLLAGDRQLVLVVDDVDRVDPPTLDLLLTITSAVTWRQAPVVALFAGRTERMPVELADLLPRIPVRALDDRDAERLLDRAGAPTGSARLEILRRAAGNPLALLSWTSDGGVTQVFARRVRELPEASRRALTLAAAGERNVAVLARAEPALTPDAWRPAEEAGLVTVADAVIRFRHPLVEFAVLDAAGANARRRAHRELARATADPRRALWHRAEAADGADPGLAAELIAAADPLRGAAAVTAVGLLEQACDLLPAEERAPILIRAAARAAAVGRVRWASDIAERARAVLPPDPGVRAELAAFTSWVLTMRGRVAEAGALITAALTDSTPVSAPPVPFAPISAPLSSAAAPLSPAALRGLVETGALPAFLLGDGPLSDALRAVVPGASLFPRALLLPDEEVRAAILAVPEPTTPAETGPAAVAGAGAMLIDEPEQALRLLGPAVQAAVEGTAASAYLTAPTATGWALIDTGRWVEAEQLLLPLIASPVMAEAIMVRDGAAAQLAVISSGRGRVATTEALPAEPALALRLGWARGVAAAAVGDHDEAYRWLRAAAAIRHPWRPLVLPDLITAAGHATKTTAKFNHLISPYAEIWQSLRKQTRLAAATALLIPDPAGSAERLAAVLDTPGTQRWPFERAVLAVELADRLRRAQQPARAREVLVSALDTFERLRAEAWTARVHAELRTATPPAAAVDLTAQQEQIIRLAAQGLTNREIGERLFLSPRTVGSHLYRMFPQLGVTNRTQLGELVTNLDRRSPTKDPQ